jgi:hypothetical protein
MVNQIGRRRDVLGYWWLALPMAWLVGACGTASPTGEASGGGSPGPIAGSPGSAGRASSAAGGAPGRGGSVGAGASAGMSSTGGLGGAVGSAGTSGGSTSVGGAGQTGGTAGTGTIGSAGVGGSGVPASGGMGGGGGALAAGGGQGGGAGRGAGAGGQAGSGVAGSGGGGGTMSVTFQKAAGTIQNSTEPSSTTNLAKSDWQKGLISPTLLAGHHLNQPAILNGYLMMCGNEEFWIYDVSNATAPKELGSMTTPNRRSGGEAESHTESFARYGDKLYMATLGGTGIDTWDVTSPTAPKHLSQLKLSGVNYGDYTEAVWGVTWQGQYIYVGATNNGIKVVDAADPAALKVAAEVPTSQFGGVSAGPLDAIGNILVVTTPKESGGVATLDISDPLKPTRLASFTADKSYIGQFHRHYAVLLGPVRVWDVLTNPKSIGTGTTPIAQFNNEYAEYSIFSDDYLFIGHARQEIGNVPGASKITFSDPKSMKVVNRIWGRLDTTYNDDQFVLPMGNLVVLTDDQSPYRGWVVAVHQTAPDTTAPVVDTVIPNDKATGASVKSRIGVTFSDNIELATVNAASFIVRPVGGQPLAGKYGVRMSVVNFDPDEDLQPATTYEVVLPKGGIADFVGNTLTTDRTTTFTTN